MSGRERMSIQHLVSNNGRSASTHPLAFPRHEGHSGDRTYLLKIVQEPTRGAEYGNYVLSRLPLSPPLIVQLQVFNRAGPVAVPEELPLLVAHIHLLGENGVPIQDPAADAQRLIYGSLVSSAQIMQDLNGQPGYFFLFPDVSLKVRGRYRLGISLSKLRMDLMMGGAVAALAQEMTEVFEIVPQSQYVAPAVTKTSVHFHQQGARLVKQL